MNVELKGHNQTKDFFQNLHNRVEDLLFTVISKMPERLIPSPLLNWLDRYTTRRINELRRQIIQQNWRNIQLQKAVESLHKSNAKKAPSDD